MHCVRVNKSSRAQDATHDAPDAASAQLGSAEVREDLDLFCGGVRDHELVAQVDTDGGGDPQALP